MNARTQIFELAMEGRQVDEAVASIFHTVLFHRSLGKFFYTGEGNYSVGTLGYTDVDCDFIDLTYVCCTSRALDLNLRREISCFSEQLRGNEGTGIGQISLEFFQKKPAKWFGQQECIPWEVWTVRLELLSLQNEDERLVCREKVGDLLTEKVLYITEVMNRHEYLPKMPNQSELGLIFDTSYVDVQPYLFKLNYVSGQSASSSITNTMKKLIKAM
ncbi:PREDICTED: autophagy-related protein 101 [Nicrophorus vespilloides]|uniref:Autophagy-related protein 101 n=1 Tax=Nicrophorus vespilloides TaxID=110193 RepID=A0ABM1MX48_NICVS|nr:PREDICTED: autophagy-related protein 101 [Nicrophorus vespilloides]